MKKKNIALLLCMVAMLLTCKKEDQSDVEIDLNTIYIHKALNMRALWIY